MYVTLIIIGGLLLLTAGIYITYTLIDCLSKIIALPFLIDDE